MIAADFTRALERGRLEAARYRLLHPAHAGPAPSGLQRGHLAGTSLDYKDFREYQPGDDLRHIDWNAYARSDRLILKLFHEEVTPHLDLFLDHSLSMALPETRKAEAALALTSFFATAADHAAYSRRAWLSGSACLPLHNSDGMPSSWASFHFDQTKPPGPGLLAAAHSFRAHGVRIFISDLLWPDEPEPLVAALARDASALLIVQVLAHKDLQPPPTGKLRLVDSETGAIHELRFDAATRRRFSEVLARHRSAWREAAHHAGASFTTLEAERFLLDWRFDDEAHHFLSIQ